MSSINKHEPIRSAETVVFRGKIGEVVHIEQADGRLFEQYRRPPGTRLVIISPEKKILITKEYRHETGTVDLRLPGGKVCDSIEQYESLRSSGANFTHEAMIAATKEAREETGLDIRNPELIAISTAGATVEWDLYYFLVHDYSRHSGGQELEQGEDIEVTWLEPSVIRIAIQDGQMGEWRSAGILLGKVFPELEAKQ